MFGATALNITDAFTALLNGISTLGVAGVLAAGVITGFVVSLIASARKGSR